MNRWQRLWGRNRMEKQLDKELRFHLEQHTADLISGGHDPSEARRLATLALGGTEQVKENCRDARGTRWLENLWLDLRYAVRSYGRSPGFTVTAVLAVAVGIGATSAVFSITDRILFRHLPYEADNQLVSLGMLAKVVDDGEFLFASDYKDLLQSNTPFQQMTSWSGVEDCDITQPNPIRQRCAEVDANFLSVLGVHPILGSPFAPTDTQPGAPRAVILSYGVWQSRFAADRTIVGTTLMLDGAPARIAGVLPRSFELPTLQHADLLVPQIILPAGWQHGATRVLRVVGRLKDGVSLASARSQLQPLFARMLAYVPAPFRKEVQFRVRSIRDRQMGSSELAAWTLLGAVLMVMLISCANVANLLLARMAGRQTELAIRTAIGISRARLLCQLLTESLLLALTGGIIGCAVGSLLLRVLISADRDGIPHLADASLDGRVLIFSLLLSLLTGVTFGLAPALQQRRSESSDWARVVAPRSSTLLKNGLVVAQIGLSIVLVSAAGLLTRSLWNLETQSLGMRTGHVMTAQLILPASRYSKPEERIAFFNQIEQKLNATPGIRSVGLSDSLPPSGWERSRPLSSLEIEGQPRKEAGTGGLVNWRYVSPGYFEVLRIPLTDGRVFKEEDRQPQTNLCVISESLQHRLFPVRNAIGQHLRIGTRAAYEIVGVVPDVKNTGLAVSSNPEYYILRNHTPDDTYINATGPVAQRTLSIVLRGSMSDTELAMLVKQQIASLDAALPVQLQTMNERLNEVAAGPRFNAVLLVGFAAAGLLLAAVGLYGTISYLVTQRTQEIGIRMSLGATPAAIARLMLGYSARWVLIGAVAGLLAALGTSGILSSFLFRVSARDPFTLLGSVGTLLVAAFIATLHPALRAAAVEPVTTLRNDN